MIRESIILITHRIVVLISSAVMESSSGDGASGQTIFIVPNRDGYLGARHPLDRHLPPQWVGDLLTEYRLNLVVAGDIAVLARPMQDGVEYVREGEHGVQCSVQVTRVVMALDAFEISHHAVVEADDRLVLGHDLALRHTIHIAHCNGRQSRLDS